MCLWVLFPRKDEEANRAGYDRLPAPFTFNSAYPKTYPALLKIVQVVFSLIAFLCAMCAPWWTTKSLQGFRFFTTICQLFMWSVVILYLLIVLNIHHHCRGWALGEFIHYILATILFLAASITAAALAMNPPMIASAVFGFFCLFVFGAGAYVSFKEWRNPSTSLPENV